MLLIIKFLLEIKLLLKEFSDFKLLSDHFYLDLFRY